MEGLLLEILVGLLLLVIVDLLLQEIMVLLLLEIMEDHLLLRERMVDHHHLHHQDKEHLQDLEEIVQDDHHLLPEDLAIIQDHLHQHLDLTRLHHRRRCHHMIQEEWKRKEDGNFIL